MNKEEIIRTIAAHEGLSENKVEAIIDTYLNLKDRCSHNNPDQLPIPFITPTEVAI